MPQKRGKLVAVYWGDAWSYGPWVSSDDLKTTPMPVISVGFVQNHNREGILISATQSEDNKVERSLFVPKGMIKKIKTIKVKL